MYATARPTARKKVRCPRYQLLSEMPQNHANDAGGCLRIVTSRSHHAGRGPESQHAIVRFPALFPVSQLVSDSCPLTERMPESRHPLQIKQARTNFRPRTHGGIYRRFDSDHGFSGWDVGSPVGSVRRPGDHLPGITGCGRSVASGSTGDPRLTGSVRCRISESRIRHTRSAPRLRRVRAGSNGLRH